MDLNTYQYLAKHTWTGKLPGTEMGRIYLALKLAGEAGEAAEKYGKTIRDDDGVITPERRHALLLELGDVLWYTAVLAHELGFSFQQVAQANIEKLRDRKIRNVLHGSGDNR